MKVRTTPIETRSGHRAGYLVKWTCACGNVNGDALQSARELSGRICHCEKCGRRANVVSTE